MRKMKILFILHEEQRWKTENMIKFFEWTREKSMINSVLITNDKKGGNCEVYTYEPFPTVTLKKLTLSTVDTYFRKSYFKNFNQAKFKTTFMEFQPRILYKTEYGGFYLEKLSGSIGNIFKEFWKHTNISLEFPQWHNIDSISTFSRKLNYAYYLEYIDLTMDAFQTTFNGYHDISYPIRIVDLRLVLPINKEIPSYLYIIIPFKYDVWITILLSILYISSFLNIMKSLKYKYSNYTETLLETISGIIFSAFPNDFTKRKSSIIHMTYLAIMLLGFILTNIYLALSTSFLAKIVYEPQVRTIEEMVEKGVKIWAPGSTYQTQQYLMDAGYGKYVEKLIQSLDIPVAEREKLIYINGFIQNDDILEIDFQPFRRTRPKFYITDFRFGTSFLAFTFAYDSLLIEPMNFVIMSAMQSGLYYYWQETAFDTLVKWGSAKYFTDSELEVFPRKLNLRHLTILWYIWGTGILISLICFVIENIRYSLVKKKTLFRRRNNK